MIDKFSIFEKSAPKGISTRHIRIHSHLTTQIHIRIRKKLYSTLFEYIFLLVADKKKEVLKIDCFSEIITIFVFKLIFFYSF